MGPYFAIVCCQLGQNPHAWSGTSGESQVELIAEYKYLAESIASQYGSIHQNFLGDGHQFLFEYADGALQFCVRLLDAWKGKSMSATGVNDASSTPLRIGCHFGECRQIRGTQDWITRGDLARQVAAQAETDSVSVTETVLDVVDPTLYEFEPAGSRAFQGDYVASRILYRVTAVRETSLSAKPSDELTAEDWFLRAVALTGTSKENSAEESDFYQRALQLRPDYPEVHNNLAVLFRANGEEAQAAQHYREALRLRPDYPEAHYNYAMLLQLRSSINGAAQHYQEALRVHPDYVDAHYGYANLLRQMGDAEKAERHYLNALRLRPAYAEVHNNLAILLEDRGELDRAQDHYQKALRVQPDYPEAHYNYAILLENIGDPQRAIVHYLQALRLRDDYPEAHNNLAIVLHTGGDIVLAEVHYKEALSLRPDDPETHYNYALLLRAKGNEAEAELHFKIAYELSPAELVHGNQPALRGDIATSDDAGLTARELEVLRLVATGKSNREIADDLVITLSTVSHHVTRILNKTGASNRTEAAAYATRQGIVAN